MENPVMTPQPKDELPWIWNTKEIPRPDNSLDRKYYWNKIFIVSCLFAVLTDPLFLYIPILKDDIKCLMLDPKLKIVVLLLRSFTDLFYLMDIIIRIYRSKNCSGLIVNLNCRQHQMNFSVVLKSCVQTIAKTTCVPNDILIDIVALLPLPQVAILIFFSKMGDLRSLTTTRMVLLNIFALLQYVPRVLRIYLLSKELKNRPLKKEFTETPIWIKGVLNFCMYIIASHVVGAMWYFFAIQRMMICWHSACRKDDGCDNRIFGCHDHHFFRNTTILNGLCPVSVSDNSSDTIFFDFGIFATVLKYGVVGSTNYFQKFLNCFWWGLRNLSSLGSNLEPSVDGWENLYTVCITMTGLLLFLYLLGNLQMYMQFETTRREDNKRKMQIKQKMEEKDPEIELWLFKNGIPTRLIKDMKLRTMEKVQQALEVSMDTNLDNIFPLLPLDVQRRIKEPLAWLKQVPMLRGMDEGLLKIIYQKLEPVRYTDNSFIIQKDKPLDKMVYIVDGFVSIEERSSDDSSRGVGELCGQELLRWPFYSNFSYFFTAPRATESVKAIGGVEALAINAQDLRSIYLQSDIIEKENPRHKRMMKEEMEGNIDGLIRKNGIPERLNHDVKLQIIKELFQENKVAYWNKLDWYDLVYRLPQDFKKEIKSYMSLTRLTKISAFRYMDELVLKEICCHLRPMKYNRTDNIIEKGDPIQVLLIVEGRIGHEGWVKGAGEYYGEELLRWLFSTSFPDRVPTAAESLSVITDVVEVLVLTASDMTSVATEFRKHFIKNYGILVQNVYNFPEWKVKEATINYTRTNVLTLVEHFHRNKSKLSLESRMKIAAEIAGTLAHVHTRSIIHSNVKTANILIDHTTDTVKVTGFGASRLLDEDEGEMEDEVSTLPGTSRCLDPQYLKSHDVYSFGVVLVELLTRQEALSSDGSETSLANDFLCSVEEDRLGQILDGEINADEFSFDIAKKVSELAVKCLRSRWKERPSMEDVAVELEGVVQTIINRVDSISSASGTSE